MSAEQTPYPLSLRRALHTLTLCNPGDDEAVEHAAAELARTLANDQEARHYAIEVGLAQMLAEARP